MADADIELLFGVLGGGSVSGDSGLLIKRQLDSIVKELNKTSNERGIVLSVDYDKTKKLFQSSIENAISNAVSNSISGKNSNINLKVAKIDASSAIQDVRKELLRMMSALKVSSGLNISMMKDFIGKDTIDSSVKSEFDGLVERARALQSAVDGAEASLEKFKSQQSALSPIEKGLDKSYNTAMSGKSTIKDADAVERISESYANLKEQLVKIKSLGIGIDDSDFKAIQSNVLALQKEISTIQDAQKAEEKRAAAADVAAKAEEKAIAKTTKAIEDSNKTSINKRLSNEETMLAGSYKSSNGGSGMIIDQTALTELNSQYDSLITKIENLKANPVATEDDFSALREEARLYKENISLIQEKQKSEMSNSSTLYSNMSEERQSKALSRVISLYKQVSLYAENNNKIVGTWRSKEISSISSQLNSMVLDPTSIDTTKVDSLKASFDNLASGMRTAGLEGKSMSSFLKQGYERFGGWILVTRSFTFLIRQLKNMAIAVKEIDTAMTELRKVTDETRDTYDSFLKNAFNRSSSVGASLAETINSTADFSRLGFSLRDASTLADVSLLYKNVGDEINGVDEASESVISTMKAFGIEARNAMSIVDKFNYVGNNFAISSGGIGQALIRSASSMASANNTLEESIALITSANTVVQNPEKVGTALKTISMFLRASKTEAEEAGESTDGMAESVSKLRGEILSLTGGKVDIQIDEDTFKSTYEIFKELSAIWDDLSDISQANILEKIGGKRNSNITSAMISGMNIAEDVMASMGETAGSALAENEKYLDSISGKMTVFQASFQSLSSNVVNSKLFKGVIEFGTNFLDITNNIVDGLGMIPIAITGISSVLSAKNISSAITPFKVSAGGTKFSLRSSLIDSFTADKSAIEKYKTLLQEAEAAAGATGVSQDKLGEISKASMLNASSAAMEFVNGQNSAQISTDGLLVKLISQKVATYAALAAQMALNAAFSMGAALLISVIVKAADTAIRTKKEIKEAAEDTMATFDAEEKKLNENKKTIDSISEKYTELSKGVNEFGKNISLTESQYEEYNSIANSIADMFPQLIAGYTEEGNAIIRLKGDVEALTAAYDENNASANHNLLVGAGDVFQNFKNQFDTSSSAPIMKMFGMSTGAGTIDKLGFAKEFMDAYQTGSSNSVNDFFKKISSEEYQYGYDSFFEGTGIGSFSNIVAQNGLVDMEKLKKFIPAIGSYYKSLAIEIESGTKDVRNAISAYMYEDEVYNSLSEMQKRWADVIVKSIDAETINNFDDFYQLAGWVSQEMSGLFNDEKTNAKITLFADAQTSFNNNEITVDEWQENVDTFLTVISSLDKDTQRAIKIAFGVEENSDTDTKIAHVMSLLNDDYDNMVGQMTMSELELAYRIEAKEGSMTFEDLQKTIENLPSDIDIIGLTSDVESATSAFDTLNSALKDQEEKGSITYEQYTKLIEVYSEYADCVEVESGSLVLNAEKARELTKEKANLKLEELELQKAVAYQKWEENAEAIDKLRNSTEKLTDEQLASIIEMENENDELSSSIDKYNVLKSSIVDLTGAYKAWADAQNAPDKGDMYASLISTRDQIQESISSGEIGTNKYKTAVELLVPEANKEDVDAYMNTLNRYITEDASGSQNFIDDMVSSGIMSVNDGMAEINPGTTLERVCEELTITPEMARAMFDNLEKYGGEFHLSDKDFENVIPETAWDKIDSSIKSRIYQIENGGSVDLKLRPEVDISVLDGVGWETEGVKAASVFCKTFTDESGDIAVNFTPIITDENGVYKGVMSEDSLDDYVKGVLAGGEDSYNLQIGAEYTGSTAVLDAKKDAEDLQGIFSSIYSGGDGTTADEEGIFSAETVTEVVDTLGAAVDEVSAKTMGDFGLEDTTIPSIQNVLYKISAIDKELEKQRTLGVDISFPSPSVYVPQVEAGSALATGTEGAAGGKTLVGELGRELVVSDGMYYTVGNSGAEFVNLKRGDIVFNHEDTERIMSSKASSGPALEGGTGAVDDYLTELTGISNYVVVNSTKKGASQSSVSSAVKETANDIEETLKDTLDDMKTVLSDAIGDFEHQILIFEKTGVSSERIAEIYGKMQEAVHEQAEKYRSMGLDENSDYIQEMQKQWWDYAEKISELRKNDFDDYIKDAKFALDGMERNGNPPEDFLTGWRNIIKNINAEIEYYRSIGKDDTSDDVQDLLKELWDAEDEIQSILKTVVSDAQNAVDDVQDIYDTLKSAAKEYANSGFVTVDTLQSIIDMGVEYFSMLQDENGQLVINEESIKRITAARTEQLAIESSLSYIEQLRIALDKKQNSEVERLLTTTDETSDATWNLVYANLALLDLSGSQYDRALENINSLRSIADTTIANIGSAMSDSGDSKSGYYNDAADALDGILDLTIDLIKYEKEQQIDALNDQIEHYKEIIDLKKESLEETKNEKDYSEEVADKIDAIAKLQSKIDFLSLDDSREAKASKTSLEQELADKQKELADYQYEYNVGKQQDALDDEADAFDKAKHDEIDKIEKTVSSTEKLYRLAIDRITNHWDTLYNDIIEWNYAAGNSLESEIVEKWNAAADAVQRYGTYVDAVSEIKRMQEEGDDDYSIVGDKSDYSGVNGSAEASSIVDQMKTNSLRWWTATDEDRGAVGEYQSDLANKLSDVLGETITSKNGYWYRENGSVLYTIPKNEIAASIVNAMKSNSAKWPSAGSADRRSLEDQNRNLASRLAGFLGKTITIDNSGVWWLDGKRLYDVYHTGGIVGGGATVKQNEVMALLEKGEAVLDAKKEEGLYKLIDFASVLSEKIGKAVNMNFLRNAFGSIGSTFTPLLSTPDTYTNESSSFIFNPSINVSIAGGGEMTTEEATRFGKIVAENTLSELKNAFSMKGVGRIGSAALRQ